MFTTFHLHFETKQAEMMVSAIITAEGLQRRWCFQKRLYENMANKQASLVYNCSSANEENCAPLASVATDRFEAEVWIKMSTSFDGWPTTDWSLKPPTPFCKVNSSLSVTLFRIPPSGGFIQELVSNSSTYCTRFCICLVRNAYSLWIGGCKALMRKAVGWLEIKLKLLSLPF